MIRRFLAASTLVGALSVGTLAGWAAPALADGSSDTTDCSNVAPGAAVTGCPDATFDDPSDPGIPGAFVGFAILAIAIGIGTTAWRVSTARRLARNAGLDPSDATAVTLLGNDGLDAAYIASAVRSGQRSRDLRDRPDITIPRPTSVEDRLRELQRLHDQGLVTDEEYTHRRSAIVNTL